MGKKLYKISFFLLPLHFVRRWGGTRCEILKAVSYISLVSAAIALRAKVGGTILGKELF